MNTYQLLIGLGIVAMIAVCFWFKYYSTRTTPRAIFLINRVREKISNESWVKNITQLENGFEIETELKSFELADHIAEEFEALGFQTCAPAEFHDGVSFDVTEYDEGEKYICDIFHIGQNKWAVFL